MIEKNQFNENQIRAISHKEGPAIVLAGPGSGKTTVITERINNLIKNHNVPPQNILVVTFTNAAAVNMKERLGQSGTGITVGTFHSIFYRIVKTSLNYGGGSIISDREKYDYIKEIAIRLKVDVSSMQNFVGTAAGEISVIKGNMLDIEQFVSSCCESEQFRYLYREYVKALNVERKLDFDDILIKCYELLCDREDILSLWQNRFQYILVDEFQDINMLQYSIIKLLTEPENNLFIVGDDDQSIYGFRGARPEIMFQFKKDYIDAKEFYLNINYRCNNDITKLSQKLVRHNTDRFEKNIVSNHILGQFPNVKKFKNQWEELKHTCQMIDEYKRKGINLNDMAILVRNNSQIYPVKEFLQNHQLEVKSSAKGKGIYECMVAKDVSAYIKAALNLNRIELRHNEDLIFILNKPSRLISRQLLAKEGMSFEKLKSEYSHNTEVLQNIKKLQFDLQMIAKLNPVAAISYIRFGANYEEYLKQYARDKDIKFYLLTKQLELLQKDAAGYKTCESWLDAIEDKKNNYNTFLDGINILTMHGAKGLEFKAVFLIDINQGIIPGSRAVRDRDFEEERRLFYVAMTRAKWYLNIYCVTESLGSMVEPSIFLKEIKE